MQSVVGGGKKASPVETFANTSTCNCQSVFGISSTAKCLHPYLSVIVIMDPTQRRKTNLEPLCEQATTRLVNRRERFD